MVLNNFAGGTDGADLIDEEILHGLIAIIFISYGVFLKHLDDIILFIGETDHINLFILSFEFIGNSINVLHGVIMFRIDFLQIKLHDHICSLLIAINFTVQDVIPSARKLYSVDVVDDGVDFVKLYVQVNVVIDEL